MLNNETIYGNDLFPFFSNGKWGYMDRNGKVIIPTQYLEADYFSEDLAAVMLQNNKWGYINTSGEIQIKAIFNIAFPFKNGHAVVAKPLEDDGYILFDSSEMYTKLHYTYYVIKVNGKYVFKMDTYGANQISDDGVLAITDPEDENTWALYNIKSKIYHKTIYKDIGGFFEGFARAKDEDWQSCYINSDGKMILTTDFDTIGDFSEGLAIVSKNFETFGDIDGVYGPIDDIRSGAIDKTGKLVIPLSKYRFIGNFNDGIAIIVLNNKYGLMNAKGELVVTPQYEYIQSYHNGLFMVCNKNREFQYYSDIEGKKIYPKV